MEKRKNRLNFLGPIRPRFGVFSSNFGWLGLSLPKIESNSINYHDIGKLRGGWSGVSNS